MPNVKRAYSMRPDGKIIVDINALLQSDRVQKDLATLRDKLRDGKSEGYEGEKGRPSPTD